MYHHLQSTLDSRLLDASNLLPIIQDYLKHDIYGWNTNNQAHYYPHLSLEDETFTHPQLRNLEVHIGYVRGQFYQLRKAGKIEWEDTKGWTFFEQDIPGHTCMLTSDGFYTICETAKHPNCEEEYYRAYDAWMLERVVTEQDVLQLFRCVCELREMVISQVRISIQHINEHTNEYVDINQDPDMLGSQYSWYHPDFNWISLTDGEEMCFERMIPIWFQLCRSVHYDPV